MVYNDAEKMRWIGLHDVMGEKSSGRVVNVAVASPSVTMKLRISELPSILLGYIHRMPIRILLSRLFISSSRGNYEQMKSNGTERKCTCVIPAYFMLS
jgi:hypothetical protein